LTGTTSRVLPCIPYASVCFHLADEQEGSLEGSKAPINVTVQWEKSYMKGDIDSCIAFYSDDATMMTFDGIVARGRDEIRGICELWQRVGPPKRFEYETLLSEVRGNLGYYAMRWSGVYPELEGDVSRSGTALSVLERQKDGARLWTAEIVSANLQ